MVGDDEGEGKRDEDDPGPSVPGKSEPQEEGGDREELADGRGDRVGGLEHVGHRRRHESRGEEPRRVPPENANGEEEDERRDQGGDRWDDQVEGAAEPEPTEGRAGYEEEHPRKIGVGDPPSRIREGDMARRGEAPRDPEVLPDVGPEVHEAGEGQEPKAEREGDDREEGGRGRFPHPAGDGCVVEKVVAGGRRTATSGRTRRSRRPPSPSRGSPGSWRTRT